MSTIDSDSTKFKTSLQWLLVGGAFLISSTAAGITLWNKAQRDIEDLNKTTGVHTSDINSLKMDVSQIQIGMVKFQANQESQIEILKYLARDRRGPLPDAAK